MSEKKESAIDKHQKAYKKIEPAVDTTDHHHRAAYLQAEKNVLMDDKGEIEYGRLDKGFEKDGKKISAEDARKQFRVEMKDYYETNVVKDSKLKKILKDMPKELKSGFLKILTGYDEDTLTQYHDTLGGGMKWDTYQREVLPGFKQEKRQALEKNTIEHISKGDISDIIEETEMEVHSDPTLTEAKRLLEAHSRGKGHISEDEARRILKNKYKGHK